MCVKAEDLLALGVRDGLKSLVINTPHESLRQIIDVELKGPWLAGDYYGL